jgi:rhodanese-related sulfurtransferase
MGIVAKDLYPRRTILRFRQGIWQGILLCCLGAALAAGFNSIRLSGAIPWVGAWPSAGTAGGAEISLREAWSRYQEGTALLVDARDAASFKQGHIKGAWSIPPGETGSSSSFDEIRILAQAGLIVIVYCDGANCTLGPALAQALRQRGVPSVRVMTDGWRRWQEAGYPVERREQ